MRARLLICMVGLLTTGLLPTNAAQARALETYLEGNPGGTAPAPVSGGLLLMGGGDHNPDAMQWFIAKAGHGHIVILRASQHGEASTEFYREIGGVLSAETFVTHSKSASYDKHLLDALSKADGVYIAGGDQARYVRRWRGTPVAKLLDAHVAAGKPLAGTSAGLAMLGEYLYGCMDGHSMTGPEGLADPYGKGTTIETDFLHLALLKGVLTDSHFTERSRLGRLFAFLAKAQASRAADAPPLLGVGVDEAASLALEPDGTGRVYATTPGTGVSLVYGAGIGRVKAPGPLVVKSVHVTGAGPDSRVHLPVGTVDKPTFERDFTVGGGTFAPLP